MIIADCAPGFFCNYNLCYSGWCAPSPPSATLACTPNGQACGGAQPQCCEGECRGGTCAPYTACGEASSSCQTDLDCCDQFYCQGGSCTASCGLEYAPCQSGNDCCLNQGLNCQVVTGTTAVCYPGSFWQPYDSQNNPIPCGAADSGWQCQVGAACTVTAAGDPCAIAGEVCDQLTQVCRAPETDSPTYFTVDQCIPNGEFCQQVADSVIQPVCYFFASDDAGYCVQPCTTTGDCLNPEDTCALVGDGGTGYCQFWEGCSTYFQPCNSSTDAGDGLCMPEDFGYGLTGFCTQALTDGGGSAGSRCLSNDASNRQNKAFCDTKDICNHEGLCEPICNAGLTGVDAGPGCPAGQTCFDWLHEELPFDEEIGFCSPACDFTAPDGGGCPVDAEGVPEKCLPRYFLDLTDVASGFCIAGAASPLAVGQICPYSFDGQITSAIDTCVAGSFCFSPSAISSLRTCTQFCDRVGQSAGCPAGTLCTALILDVGIPDPTHTGYCN